MAIQWGNNVGNFRLGIDVVGNTWILYGQSIAYGHNWNYTIQFGGGWGSGTKTGSFYSAYGETKTVELHRTSRDPRTETNTARLTSALVNGAYVSRSITVTPKPAAPSNISVARNSDSSHTVSWTRNATATSVRLERRTNGGSWQHVSSVSSNAASITDTTTKAGNRYQYRVRVANAGGTSDWSNLSNVVYTTPPVPTGITATRVGDNIRVGATVHANASHVDIQDDGTTVVSALAKASLPWTHSSPSQVVTHKYRMRARVASGTSNSTTLYSGWSTYSATVQLTAPPSAPTGLSPNGSVVETGTNVSLSWKHSPVDSSEQSAYELRHRVDGGAWTTLSGTTASSRSLTVGVGVVEWQVRTKGAHPDWSPWSAVASVTFVDQPTVAILSPDGGQFFEAVLPVTWSFFQGQGRPQSAWRARLLRDGQVLETKQGTGSASSTTFSNRLEDGHSYTVEVDAASGSIWSTVESVTVDASFILPAPGVLSAAWNESTGAVDLDVSIIEQDYLAPVTNYAPRVQGSDVWSTIRKNVQRYPTMSAIPNVGWQNHNGAVRVSGGASDGLLVGVNTDVPAAYAMITNTNSAASVVSAGDEVRGVVAVRVPVGKPAISIRASLSFTNAANGVIQTSTGDLIVVNPGQSELLTVTAIAPANTVAVRSGIYNGPNTLPVGTEFVILDDWTVEVNSAHLPVALYSGNTPDFSIDPDMRTRWVGAQNSTETVMEGERVAGVTDWQCRPILSNKNGVPTIRAIPTGEASVSEIYFPIPVGARGGGTLIASIYLEEPTGGPFDATPRRIGVTSPTQWSDGAPNTAGTYPQRLEFSELASVHRVQMRHGGRSGDLWWLGIGLFEGSYIGDFFNGDTEWVQIEGRWMHTRWNPDGTSVASMPDEAIAVTVERSIDGGITWSLVAENLEPGTHQLTDPMALSNGVTLYRVTSYAATGAATVREYPVGADSEAVWIGGGVGHAVTARLPYSPQITVSGGRERTMFRFSGRPKPVVYAGEGISRVVDSNGMILVGDFENAQPDALILVAQNEEPTHLYRDPDGRHVTGMLTDIQVARQSHAHWAYSFQLEESEG